MPSYHQEAHARFVKQVERSRSGSFGKGPSSYGEDDHSYGPVATLIGTLIYLFFKAVTVAIFMLAALFVYFLISGEWPALLQEFARRYL